MKIIRRHRRTDDPNRQNRYTVVVSAAAGESLPFAEGEEAGFEDMGAVHFDRIRTTNSPEPGLAKDERVYVIELHTLETVGFLPDLP